MMRSEHPIRILTVNGGSSSIKFALFEADRSLRRILEGSIERIGLSEPAFTVKSRDKAENFSRKLTAPDHKAAVAALMDWIEERFERGSLTAVGHRVVHGGPKYSQPQRSTVWSRSTRSICRKRSCSPGRFINAFPTCFKWPASTRRFIATCRAWRACFRSPAGTIRKEFDAMGFTDCPIRF